MSQYCGDCMQKAHRCDCATPVVSPPELESRLDELFVREKVAVAAQRISEASAVISEAAAVISEAVTYWDICVHHNFRVIVTAQHLSSFLATLCSTVTAFSTAAIVPSALILRLFL